MKKIFILAGLGLSLLQLPVTAQDTAATAAAIAAKQAADERYQRMASDLQAVQSDNQALHAKIDALEQQIQTLRDAQARPVDNSAVMEAINTLAKKLQEEDQKRLQDKDAISEEIRKSIATLEKTLGSGGGGVATVPTRESSPTKSTATSETPAAAVNGYSYTIQEGDRLEAIIRAYNADYKSKGLKPITLRQAMEANPKVDWTRLRVGQKIVIPRPEGG